LLAYFKLLFYKSLSQNCGTVARDILHIALCAEVCGIAMLVAHHEKPGEVNVANAQSIHPCEGRRVLRNSFSVGRAVEFYLMVVNICFSRRIYSFFFLNGNAFLLKNITCYVFSARIRKYYDFQGFQGCLSVRLADPEISRMRRESPHTLFFCRNKYFLTAMLSHNDSY
jgi:hypothetical protein